MLHHLCFSDNWFFCFLLFSLTIWSRSGTNICVKLFAENSDIDKNPEKGQESIKSAVYTSNEQKLLDKELDTLIYCKRKLGRWNLNNWTFFCMLDANHRLNWWNAPSISYIYKVHLNGSITNPFFCAHFRKWRMILGTQHEVSWTNFVPRWAHIQGVPTSLGYAKCTVLKLRKVCERS